MSREPILRGVLFLSVAFGAGCDREPLVTAIDPPADELLSAAAGETSQRRDLAALSRFDLELEVEGTLKPGEPIHIHVGVHSNLPTEAAEIKLLLPEIAAARETKQRLGSQEIIELPIGVPVPADLAAHGKPLGRGHVFREQITLRIEEPGYYMAVAIARAPSDARMTEEGLAIDNVSRRELWIWIDESGGRVTERFDSSLFPEDIHAVPGPLTPKNQPPRIRLVYSRSEMPSSSASILPNMTATSSDEVTIAFTYLNPRTDAIVPVAVAPVYVEITDEYAAEVISKGWDYTDGQGKIYKPCDTTGNESIDAWLHTQSGDADIYKNNSTVAAHESASLAACGYTFESRATASQVYTWEMMAEIVNSSRNFYAHSRGKIGVYLSSTEGSYYADDRIVILDSDSESHADASAYGDFVLAHEYGHALHHKGLGGNVARGNCPKTHYVTDEYNLQCAYSEGFANHHAAAVGYPFFNFESDDYTGSGTKDGSIIEGAVASFFLDLTDSANEPHDNVQYPGSYIANIIETCEVYTSSWSRGDGVDHLVACFENAMPDYANYFATRTSRPSQYREGVAEPSGWSPTEIRRLWRKNLYGEDL